MEPQTNADERRPGRRKGTRAEGGRRKGKGRLKSSFDSYFILHPSFLCSSGLLLFVCLQISAAGPNGVQPVPPESLAKERNQGSGIRQESEIQNPKSKIQNAEAPTSILDSLPGVKPDSAPAESSAKQDTTKHVPAVRAPRTGTAVLLSALIPGGGQFYAGYPWQGAIIGAAELTFAGLSIYEYRRGAPGADLGNAFLWWTGFSIGFSMADAYVSTALFGFKEEQRLDLRVGPAQVGIAYRF